VRLPTGFRHVTCHDSTAWATGRHPRGGSMRLLKWLGVQIWAHPLRSGTVASTAVFLAAATVASHLPRHEKLIDRVDSIVVLGLVGLTVLMLIIKAARRSYPKKVSTAAVVVIVVACAMYVLCFQILVAAIASSGDLGATLSWFKGGFSIESEAFAFASSGCLLAIPSLLVVYPRGLRERLPWDRATELSRTLLPAWLAAAAAVSTWIYALLLHFGGGPLATTPVRVLLVAALGVATLLAPLYQFMARSCWQYGPEAVFDPVRWRAAVTKVHEELEAAYLSYLRTGAWRSTNTVEQDSHDPTSSEGYDPGGLSRHEPPTSSLSGLFGSRSCLPHSLSGAVSRSRERPPRPGHVAPFWHRRGTARLSDYQLGNPNETARSRV
jgi:hypothetical protein